MRSSVKFGPLRTAFTLVELLVAMTVTLLVIFALAEAFAEVSETIRTNRAAINMAVGIRQTTARLQMDLEGVTVPVTPWVQSSWGLGYLEYYDGPANDADADGDGTMDFGQANRDQSLGDLDDVLMFTARHVEAPFTGRLRGNSVQSEVAEVVWWVGAGDTNQSGAQEAGEYSLLYRRALLVRPDLNGPNGYFFALPDPTIPNQPTQNRLVYNITSQAELGQMYQDVITFVNDNDISVRFERQETGNSVLLAVVANTLSDLTLRQNRFCHDPVAYQITTSGQYQYLTKANLDSYYPHRLQMTTTSHTVTGAVPIAGALALARVKQSGTHLGEDVMLSNLLAFDVRAYDPYVIIAAHRGNDAQWGVGGVDDNTNSQMDGQDFAEAGWPGSDDERVLPGDPGYGKEGTVLINAVAGSRILPAGRGAFVDLNFHGKYNITGYAPSQVTPYFGSGVMSRSGLAATRAGTYDTWPFDYETDGLNQDGDSLTDEGTDGLDNDSANGVDDDVLNTSTGVFGERETAPPYPNRLRAVEVRVRVIDPDTRQVRQTTVTSNFVPE